MKRSNLKGSIHPRDFILVMRNNKEMGSRDKKPLVS